MLLYGASATTGHYVCSHHAESAEQQRRRGLAFCLLECGVKAGEAIRPAKCKAIMTTLLSCCVWQVSTASSGCAALHCPLWSMSRLRSYMLAQLQWRMVWRVEPRQNSRTEKEKIFRLSCELGHGSLPPHPLRLLSRLVLLRLLPVLFLSFFYLSSRGSSCLVRICIHFASAAPLFVPCRAVFGSS